MNDREQFEQQLRKQPLRTVPSAWRGEILSAATEGRCVDMAKNRGQQSRGGCLDALRGLLWPHPVAWGFLAAVWLVIAAVNWSVGDERFAATATASPQVESQQLRALLADQHRVLAEILNDMPLPAEPADARPRSARNDKILCV